MGMVLRSCQLAWENRHYFNQNSAATSPTHPPWLAAAAIAAATPPRSGGETGDAAGRGEGSGTGDWRGGFMQQQMSPQGVF